MRATLISILTLFFSVSFFNVRADEYYRLFNGGTQTSDYNSIIQTLVSKKGKFDPNTFLLFDNLPPIKVKNFLGNGGLTAVFLRNDGRVLRVPKGRGDVFFYNGPEGALKNNGPYTKGMTSYMESMKAITQPGTILKIYSEESVVPYYITVDFFDAKFNIKEFYSDRPKLIREGRLTAEQVPALEAALKRFVTRFSKYKTIGDFKIEQVMTNGRNWRLLDASTPVTLAESIQDPTPFDHKNMAPKLPAEVNDEIRKNIQNERLTNLRLPAYSAQSCPALLQ